ncbi:hypothetical protein MJT46_018190 [Ovis ammon polii x Ovis aries]|nr:hypothetical protein MJT46_018190 [Ovis ammon polii x Ovis aries]
MYSKQVDEVRGKPCLPAALVHKPPGFPSRKASPGGLPETSPLRNGSPTMLMTPRCQGKEEQSSFPEAAADGRLFSVSSKTDGKGNRIVPIGPGLLPTQQTLLTSPLWAPGNKLSSLSGQKPGCASMGSTLDLRGRTPGSWDLQPRGHILSPGRLKRISHSCSPGGGYPSLGAGFAQLRLLLGPSSAVGFCCSRAAKKPATIRQPSPRWRVATPPAVDPVELFMLTEHYWQYRQTVRTLRQEFMTEGPAETPAENTETHRNRDLILCCQHKGKQAFSVDRNHVSAMLGPGLDDQFPDPLSSVTSVFGTDIPTRTPFPASFPVASSSSLSKTHNKGSLPSGVISTLSVVNKPQLRLESSLTDAEQHGFHPEPLENPSFQDAPHTSRISDGTRLDVLTFPQRLPILAVKASRQPGPHICSPGSQGAVTVCLHMQRQL